MEPEEIYKELDNLYWKGIYTAIQLLLSKTSADRDAFLEGYGKLNFDKFREEMKAFIEWRYSGNPVM